MEWGNSVAKTLENLRDEICRRLGDSTHAVWTVDEIDAYAIDGYNRMAELTHCFWDIGYLENLPYSGDHTCAWEIDYLSAGDIYQGEFKYTESWEIDYINNALGPANHVAPWEWQNSYVTHQYFMATAKLPTDCYQIERATQDYQEVDPIPSARLEKLDSRYELDSGLVSGYLMDKDGIRTLRKYKIPSSVCGYYTVDGTFGIMRDPSDITSEDIYGQWGIPRRIPDQHPCGPYSFGLPRRVFKDDDNFRIEFFRRGRSVSGDYDEFEMPDAYCKHIRFYGMWKALLREGPGQDLELAKHYESRWVIGLGRIGNRKIDVKSNRVGRMGGSVSKSGRPPRPSLPWNYGRMSR